MVPVGNIDKSRFRIDGYAERPLARLDTANDGSGRGIDDDDLFAIGGREVGPRSIRRQSNARWFAANLDFTGCSGLCQIDKGEAVAQLIGDQRFASFLGRGGRLIRGCRVCE